MNMSEVINALIAGQVLINQFAEKAFVIEGTLRCEDSDGDSTSFNKNASWEVYHDPLVS